MFAGTVISIDLIEENEDSSQVERIIFVRYSQISPESNAHGCLFNANVFFKLWFRFSKLVTNQDQNSSNEGPTSREKSNFTDHGIFSRQHCKAVTQGIFHFPCSSLRSNNNSV